MSFKETLATAREQRGMTQQDLAEKLYVTRQAVSRWENGETEPSVDMRKLIATVLDVPVIQLFDIDVSQLCQCCGTPFTVPNMPHGTDADGAENTVRGINWFFQFHHSIRLNLRKFRCFQANIHAVSKFHASKMKF